MKRIIFFFLVLIGLQLNAQEVISGVKDIEPKSDLVKTFPAHEGDELLIEIEKIEGKKLGKITVANAEEEIIYMRYDVKDLKKKIIIKEAGTYTLRIENDGKKNFKCSLAVHLTDKEKKKRKITNVRVVDTSFGYMISRAITVKSLETSVIQNDQFYLNSKSNALVKGGKKRVLIPIALPEGTKEWYFVYTASRDQKQIEQTLQSFSLASELTAFIEQKASLQDAVKTLSVPPGANIINIYLLDEKNARLFKANESFTYDIDHSREQAKSGIINVDSASKANHYLGISNPDNLHGIHVGIEVVAIVAEDTRISEQIRIPIYTSYTIPTLVEE